MCVNGLSCNQLQLAPRKHPSKTHHPTITTLNIQMAFSRSMNTRSLGIMKKATDLHHLSGAECAFFVVKDGIAKLFLTHPDLLNQIKDIPVWDHNSFTPDNFDTVASRAGRTPEASGSDSSPLRGSFSSTRSSTGSQSSTGGQSSPGSQSSTSSVSTLNIAQEGVKATVTGTLPIKPISSPDVSQVRAGAKRTKPQLRPRNGGKKPRKDWF
ncbi:hypothetical protein BX600DRAFT_532457 [Xylariales sp. PMI_506]|nr:hypothetical protein BX600DRAFT_532457 [Xylariales sp. PMI_506]